MKKNDFVKLVEHHAVIDLPENAVSITVNIDVYQDGEIETVSKAYDINDIRVMFNKADVGYFADDDMWVLTEKGRKTMEQSDVADGV